MRAAGPWPAARRFGMSFSSWDGVSDLERSRRFYDAALRPLALARTIDFDRVVPIMAPHPVRSASSSRSRAKWPCTRRVPGFHFCFGAPDRAAVHAFHAAALGAGGRDDGVPSRLEPLTGTYVRAVAGKARTLCGKQGLKSLLAPTGSVAVITADRCRHAFRVGLSGAIARRRISRSSSDAQLFDIVNFAAALESLAKPVCLPHVWGMLSLTDLAHHLGARRFLRTVTASQ